jgi:hypothetical protein
MYILKERILLRNPKKYVGRWCTVFDAEHTGCYQQWKLTSVNRKDWW